MNTVHFAKFQKEIFLLTEDFLVDGLFPFGDRG